MFHKTVGWGEAEFNFPGRKLAIVEKKKKPQKTQMQTERCQNTVHSHLPNNKAITIVLSTFLSSMPQCFIRQADLSLKSGVNNTVQSSAIIITAPFVQQQFRQYSTTRLQNTTWILHFLQVQSQFSISWKLQMKWRCDGKERKIKSEEKRKETCPCNWR